MLSSSFLSMRKAVLSVAYPMEHVAKLPPDTSHGVWYMSPEYHVIESCIMNIVAILIIFLANHSSTQSLPISVYDNYDCNIQNIMKYLLTMDYCLHMYYKAGNAPKGRGLWWLLQPCSMNQFIILIFLYFPRYLTTRILQYLLTLTCGAANAMLFPDTASFTKCFSEHHFWFQHLSIYILPHYWLIHNAHIMRQTLSISNALTTHAMFMLYQFVILETGSILTGVNLNYCMSPPPTKILTQHGHRYRIIMTCIMSVAHTLSGYVVPCILLFIARQIWVYN
eukprot:25618_1